MEELDFLADEPGAAPEPAPKRRKLRKGTRSCWECKRRKARCVFSAATEHICEGCKRRGTDCISQEDTQEPPPQGSNRHLVDRLGQVEALVGRLLMAAENNAYVGADVAAPTRLESRQRSYGARPRDSRRPQSPKALSSSSPNPLGLTLPNDNVLMPGSRSNRSTTHIHVRGDNPTWSPHAPPSTTRRYDALCRELLNAWPSPQDMDTILSIPVESSSLIRAAACTQPTTSAGSGLPSPKTLLQRPPPGSHPLLIARKLLILATFLQSIPFSQTKHLESLSISYHEIMSRAVATSHNLVTCNDELSSSIEAVECIFLESLYENYAGNLRRSWLTTRRAVTIAQMLGLDRGVKPSALAGSTIEPDSMWFRVIQFDRYLCLMLSLPLSVLDDGFATPEDLASCSASERFQRLTCVASGRLLRRHQSEMYDPVMTKEIDKLLQEASEAMPALWWVAPNLSTCNGHTDRIRETLRFNDHFMYYHLLVQLHLPYLLLPRYERQYDYNRMTAVTASREVLSRLVSFRTCHPVGTYCRGVDFLTFVSGAALCLAHINDQQHIGKGAHGSCFLAHQRLSDRGLLEQTLGIMQEIACQHDDAIATIVVTLLQHLLPIEKDVASGENYNVRFSPEPKEEEDLGCKVKLNDNDNGTALRIYLPHFWVIKIQPQDSQKTLPAPNSTDRTQEVPREVEARPGGDPTPQLGSMTATEHENMGLLRPHASSPQVVSITAGKSEISRGPDIEGQGLFSIERGANSWALDDVDFGFLDSFIEETTGLDAQL